MRWFKGRFIYEVTGGSNGGGIEDPETSYHQSFTYWIKHGGAVYEDETQDLPTHAADPFWAGVAWGEGGSPIDLGNPTIIPTPMSLSLGMFFSNDLNTWPDA